MTSTYRQPTHDQGRDLVMRRIDGPVVMLNLLRFRDIADYAAHPTLQPSTPISGEDAFDLYIRHSLPHLRHSGGEVMMLGKGAGWFIGPADERWDLAMLIRQCSVQAFLSFSEDTAYLEGMAHREAAIEDSRLLPLQELAMPLVF